MSTFTEVYELCRRDDTGRFQSKEAVRKRWHETCAHWGITPPSETIYDGCLLGLRHKDDFREWAK